MAESNFLQFPILNGFSGNEWLAIATPVAPGSNTFTMNKALVGNLATFSAGSTLQTANTVYAGPTGGGPAAATFRALVNADLPTITTLNWTGGITQSVSGSTMTFTGLTALTFGATGSFTSTAQLAAAVVARNTTDNGSVKTITLEGDRASPTLNDNIFMSFVLSDSVGTQTEIGRFNIQLTSVTDAAETSAFFWQGITSGGAMTAWMRLNGTTLRPETNDLLALGSATISWADLFLASGGVINFANGDVTITHSANTLAFTGATTNGYTFDNTITVTQAVTASTPSALLINATDNATNQAIRLRSARGTPADFDGVYASFYLNDSTLAASEFGRLNCQAHSIINGAERGRFVFSLADGATGAMTSYMILQTNTLFPATSDGLALGTSGFMWADLFLATGGVINWNNGDVTITHSANTLSFTGANLGFLFDNIINVTGTFAATAGITSKSTNDTAQIVALRLESDRATPTALDNVVQQFVLSDSAGTQTEFGRISCFATVVTDAAEQGELRFLVTNNGTITQRYLMNNTAFQPNTNNALQLGISGTAWADLFLGSGAVVDFNAADVTITHSANTLTFAGATVGYLFDSLVQVTRTGLPLQVIQTNDVASVVVTRFEGDRATPTVNDNIVTDWVMSNASGTQVVYARSGAQATNITAGTETGQYFWQALNGAGTLTTYLILAASTASLRPNSNDGTALGTSVVAWSDLFLASGGVINWNAGDVTITHAADTLTFAGATTNGYQFQDGPIRPVANDGIALGTATVSFADLFLASGALINFNNGNVTLTHATGQLSIAGGTLALAAGTTTIEPLQFTSGTNLTTAAAGAVEYDGISFYATSVASSRQVVNTEQVSVLTANFTGTDVATAQPVFTAAQDTITLAASTSYEFEAYYWLTRAAGTTSHTTATLFGGTATFTSIGYWAQAANPTGNNLGAISTIQGTSAAALVVTAANTSATENVMIWLRGTIRVNAGGTLIPQIQFSSAPGGAPTFQANSYFRIWPIGTNTVASVGNWA